MTIRRKDNRKARSLFFHVISFKTSFATVHYTKNHFGVQNLNLWETQIDLLISAIRHHLKILSPKFLSQRVQIPLIGKSWKTHPEIFLKFSFFWSSHRPFYWKTHPDPILHIIYGFSQKIEWMSFTVKRSVWRPRIHEI